MKAPFRFLPSFGSFKIGGFLYVCLLGRLACHSFFTIFGEPVYIYIEREDFLKRMKTSFIYIQIYTYNIGVDCETSMSFHAQCLQTCIHLQTRLLLMRYEWMSEGYKLSICLHHPIFKGLRSWQNQRVFWLSQPVRLLKWTICFGKLKQFGLSKHTVHSGGCPSVILILLLCSYSTTRL